MKRAYLTIGPQYAGKSTFCEKVVAKHPEAVLVSRDKILIQLFGTVWLNPYDGEHFAGLEVMWREIKAHLKKPGIALILDTWNAQPEDRSGIARKLNALGADRIVGWHFITPLNTCLEWSFQRDPIEIKNKWSELRREIRIEQYTRIHKAFCALRIEKENAFDSVRRINSLEPIPGDILHKPHSAVIKR